MNQWTARAPEKTRSLEGEPLLRVRCAAGAHLHRDRGPSRDRVPRRSLVTRSTARLMRKFPR